MRSSKKFCLPAILAYIFFFILTDDILLARLFDEPLRFIAFGHENRVFIKTNFFWKRGGALPNNIVTEMNSEDYSIKNIFMLSKNQSYNRFILSLIHRGLYESNDFGETWVKQNRLLKRNLRYDPEAEREVMYIDHHGQYLVHKHNILYRNAQGSWALLQHNLKYTEYYTSIHSTSRFVYLGTSVNGLYRAKKTSNKGRLYFRSFSRGLPYIAHNQNVKFYEEIGAIHVSSGNIYLGTATRGGIYVKYKNENSFRILFENPHPHDALDIYQISLSSEQKTLWASTSKGLLVLEGKKEQKNLFTPKWMSLEKIFNKLDSDFKLILVQNKDKPSLYAWFRKEENELPQAKKERIEKADCKILFYSSPLHWKQKLHQIRSLLKGNFYNGMVVDVKDDQGYVRYASQVPLAKKIGAVRKSIQLRELIRFAHKHKKWMVARIVVFKDPVLFRNPEYAILNKKTKQPWTGNPRERWIDPYNSKLAEEYYVPMIRELTRLGIDEIQLDYIRFPSDGDVWNAFYRHRQNRDIYLSEALEDFLYSIRKSTHLPISLDIYGYNALYRAPGLVGQDMQAYGRHADIIAPMLYSSHFGDKYMAHFPKEERAYRLLNESALRYRHLSRGRFLVRPWLQAFAMKTSIWGYGKKYFQDQIKGVWEQGTQGFMFWGSIKNMKEASMSENSHTCLPAM